MSPATTEPAAPAMKAAPAQPEAAPAKEVEGKIKSMDRSRTKVTLEDGTTLTIPSSLKAARGALTKGARVKATYEEKGGQKVVTSLEVRL
jgi:Cu/Ag efflux protein CusF